MSHSFNALIVEIDVRDFNFGGSVSALTANP
jgi:hypothetical protein